MPSSASNATWSFPSIQPRPTGPTRMPTAMKLMMSGWRSFDRGRGDHRGHRQQCGDDMELVFEHGWPPRPIDRRWWAGATVLAADGDGVHATPAASV